MKIISVLGARPQFIKFAPVDVALKAAGTESVLIHTGQHYDANMSDVFFEELSIAPPRHHLGIGSGAHGKQTGAMMAALEPILIEERPDWALIFGDTNSTLAAALVASKLHVPIAHVEAGLRSFNRRMPEEINRVVADHLSSILFAPTETSVRNLATEGMSGDSVVLCGDVMFDAAMMFAAHAEARSTVLRMHALEPKCYALATIHRAENTDDPARLAAIMAGLTNTCRDIRVILPVHPRTRKLMSRDISLAFEAAGGILTEPVGYLDMIQLERNAIVIVTDSGGVQKEAYFHGVPCVTLREETEWIELVEAGWNTLVPPQDPCAIARMVTSAKAGRREAGALYGTGYAAKRIAEKLTQFARQASR